MGEESGCKSCLSVTGMILGILAAVVTIVGFFFPNAETFLAAVEDIWVNSFLGNLAPSVGDFLEQANDALFTFAQSSPLHPWWTAALIIVLGGVVKHWAENELFDYEFTIKEIPIWGIPAALWLFVFFGTAGMLGAVVFLVAYVLGSIGVDFLWNELETL
jgi:hypothetical protein